jgi:hypothetical protein
MSDIKALGSERLQGMDKIKRILEISTYNEKKPVSINENSTTEYKLNLSDGNQYQIVKEKNGYVIKKTINESMTDYIDNLENRKYYKSYSQALRRLNLMAKEFNTLYENSNGTSLFTEQKKFVLKTPKPSGGSDTPPASDMGTMPPPAGDMGATPPPAGDMGAMPPPAGDMGPDMGATPPEGDMSPDMGATPPEGDMGPDMGGEEGPDMGGDMGPDMGGEEGPDTGSEEVSLKSIQKLVGKLAQKLRTISKNEDEMDSKDIKYVINSVLSAVDMDKLEDEDKEEILGRFDSEEETDDMSGEGGPDMGDESEEPNVESPEPPSESPEGGEMTEMDFEPLGKKYGKAVGDAYGIGLTKSNPFTYKSDVDENDLSYNKELAERVMNNIFSESKVDKILSKYFVVTESEKKKIKTKKNNMFSEITRLSETVDQEMIAKKIVNRNSDVKLLGKTNQKNLVFEHNNKQFKVTTSGRIL